MNKFLDNIFNFDKSKDKKNNSSDLLSAIDRDNLPQHIAIILDGNGRWAQSKGQPRTRGHYAGSEALRDIVRCCREIGIRVLTVYAFSTENWKRPEREINYLMDLIVYYLHNEVNDLADNGIKLHPIGIIDVLPEKVRAALDDACNLTADNDKMILNVALNYGGRSEITQAIKKLYQDMSDNNSKSEIITEQLISEYLYTAGQPDPDLLIRPAGDLRISNFLLWQIAYTEIWLTEKYWPDFVREDLYQAIIDFQHRERRFGGLKKDTK